MSGTTTQIQIQAKGEISTYSKQEISADGAQSSAPAWRSIAACSTAEARALVPLTTAIKFNVLPLSIFNECGAYRKTLTILASELSDKEDIKNLSPLTNCDISVEICCDKLLKSAIFAAYHSSAEHLARFSQKADYSLSSTKCPREENDWSVSQLIDQIIAHALSLGASDIHLEPQEYGCSILYRVDGAIRRAVEHKLSTQIYAHLVRRIKILSALDINNNQTPQEGSFNFNYEHVRCRIRSSIVPALYGEKTALRLLYGTSLNNRPFQICSLGFNDSQRRIVLSAISRNDGVITIAGPTGSGKSTLMAAILNELVSDTKLIVSIEDPIETELTGVTQIQVDDQKGRSYDALLPTLLRQDPDVIAVGETRNKNVAELVFAGGLSGHLVITSLHSTGAMDSPARLINLGLDKHLVASGLRLAIGVRLIPINCRHCIRTIQPPESIVELFRLPNNATLQSSSGCQHCFATGIMGRRIVMELLPITAAFRSAVLELNALELSRSTTVLNYAKSVGYRPIFLSVRQAMIAGEISPKHALSTLGLPLQFLSRVQ